MVLAVALLAAGGQCIADAQEAAKPEPEYVLTPYWYDAAANKLNPLQQQKLKSEYKTRALGYAGGTSTRQADGSRSTVRFKAGQRVEFVYQTPPSLDPHTQIEIVRFVQKRDHRELYEGMSKGIFSGAKVEENKATVPFQVEKYSASSIGFFPAEPLEPGEYAVRRASAPDIAFCFGIDPPDAR
jgi:hypothetical protein